MRVLISDSHKYIYHMNPKVASNTTLTVLYRLTGMNEEDIRNPHQTSRQAELLNKHGLRAVDIEYSDCASYFTEFPGYFTFAFTRNPYTRLKSAYNDKLKQYAVVRHSDLLARLVNEAGEGASKKYIQQQLAQHIPFSQFVQDICSRDLYLDQHWVPQYDRLRPDIIKFDILGKLENYTADLERIILALGWTAKDIRLPSKPLNSAPDAVRPDEYSSEALILLVQQAYQRDFDAFGYDASFAAG